MEAASGAIQFEVRCHEGRQVASLCAYGRGTRLVDIPDGLEQFVTPTWVGDLESDDKVEFLLEVSRIGADPRPDYVALYQVGPGGEVTRLGADFPSGALADAELFGELAGSVPDE